MDSTFRRCPFCNDCDWITIDYDGPLNPDGILQGCDNCGAQVPLAYINNRPIEDALQAEIVSLKRHLEMLQRLRYGR